MIKDLSDALRALIDSITMRPLATLVGISLLFMTYIGYRSYDSLQKLVVTPDEEASRFEEQLTESEIINSAIERLRVELKADNVMVRQFHNGRHDLTGIPFTGIETTFYAGPLEAPNGQDITADEPVSSSNDMLRRVWSRIDKPQCVVINTPVDISTRRYFRAYNLNKSAVCPLVNLLNYPIGVLVVGFSDRNIPSDPVILYKTSSIAKGVTGYLASGH